MRGLKNDEEGMMSNGRKVGYTGRKKGGKKEWTHTPTRTQTKIQEYDKSLVDGKKCNTYVRDGSSCNAHSEQRKLGSHCSITALRP